MRFSPILFLLLFLSNICFGQSEEQNIRNSILADSLQIEENVAKADSLKKAGKIDESINLLAQTAEAAETSNNPYLIQIVGLEIADSYLSNDQPDKAEQVLLSMLDRFPEANKKVNLLSMLGSAYRYQGQYDQALRKQEEALALVDSSESPVTFARLQLNLASLYDNKGDLAAALNYYQKGIEVLEETPDSSMFATALNNIGVTYNNLSKHDEAKHYMQKSIDIAEKIGNKVALLRAVNNLAIAEKGLGNIEKAIATYDEALTLHQEVRKDTPPFRILYNLGLAHKDQGNLEKAESYFKQSLSYCQEAGIAQGLIYNYGGLANTEELRGNLAQAHEYYTSALDVAKDIGAKGLQVDVLNSLYLLEKKREDHARALSYFEQYNVLADSLDEEARKQELAKVETELGLRKQREINELLQEKQQQQEAQLATQNWLIILSAAIIIIILISLVLLYRANSEKQRINEELENQRNRLEDLNKVKDKMMAIIAHDLRSPLASMHGMLYLIREEDLSREEIQATAAKLEISLDQNISMMDNLLVWARDQMSGMEIELTSHDAYEVVTDVLDSFEFRASHKGITLYSEVPKNTVVKADINLLRLILRNLVGNSLKFSNEGDKITVRASKKEDKIIFEVEDTGIGMPDKVRKTIFSENGQSRLGTFDEKGSGLGLQLCKEFIEKQRGEISVESEEGVGTNFIFSLPAS
ncbi:MAG: tetratricopeptide repeat protein [Balneolaceae bacterium]|nr:tetratricopeptide repeat protein [Balneolaceae bacterium]